MTVDLGELERELCRIPEVTAARVVAEDDRIVEVHILSLPSKHAKQIVRDVQSVALATFGVDLDRRVVSVVQLDTPGLAFDLDEGNGEGGHGAVAVAAPPRVSVASITTAVLKGSECTATVTLTRDDDTASASASGLVGGNNLLRLVAQATMTSLQEVEPAAYRASIESAAIVTVGPRQVAIVTVVVAKAPYEEVISGSAMVRTAGELDAVARAVLDATNRRLPLLA